MTEVNMNCPKCNSPIYDGARFCTACGAPLDVAAENGCESIAFCCISTGVFGFPKQEAAEIAVQTVKDWKSGKNSALKVIFNVFGDEDLAIYRRILK